MKFPTHQIIHSLLFCRSQISFSEIQLNIGVCFLKFFLCENCNFVFGLALFFHFFSDSSVFHVRNLICHLFDVTLQSFLIKFFCKKIFPVVLIFLKIRINDSVVKTVNNTDQFYSVCSCSGFVNHVADFPKTLFYIMVSIL